MRVHVLWDRWRSVSSHCELQRSEAGRCSIHCSERLPRPSDVTCPIHPRTRDLPPCFVRKRALTTALAENSCAQLTRPRAGALLQHRATHFVSPRLDERAPSWIDSGATVCSD